MTTPTFVPDKRLEEKIQAEIENAPEPIRGPEIYIERLNDAHSQHTDENRNFYLGTYIRESRSNDWNYFLYGPTLAELKSAYLGQDGNGKWVSERFRRWWLNEDELANGICTRTFIEDRRELIESPRLIFYDIKSEKWIAQEGRRTRIELPPDGWIIEFDPKTGLPTKTTLRYKKAYKIFGDDASTLKLNKFESCIEKKGIMQIRVSRGQASSSEMKSDILGGPFDIGFDIYDSVEDLCLYPQFTKTISCRRENSERDFTLLRNICKNPFKE